ncbi:hypothetical protein HZB00_03880 [Candidatus Woesearchaeota archaeon]|nr:hypothetical protein [Candidatus Woesearchaeota archaeon]
MTEASTTNETIYLDFRTGAILKREFTPLSTDPPKSGIKIDYHPGKILCELNFTHRAYPLIPLHLLLLNEGEKYSLAVLDWIPTEDNPAGYGRSISEVQIHGKSGQQVHELVDLLIAYWLKGTCEKSADLPITQKHLKADLGDWVDQLRQKNGIDPFFN